MSDRKEVNMTDVVDLRLAVKRRDAARARTPGHVQREQRDALIGRADLAEAEEDSDPSGTPVLTSDEFAKSKVANPGARNTSMRMPAADTTSEFGRARQRRDKIKQYTKITSGT